MLVLTTFELDEYVFEALRAGASGFLLKDTDPADLLRAVRVVAAGDALLVAQRHPPPDRRVRRRRAASPSRRPTALDELTDREREVLAPRRRRA